MTPEEVVFFGVDGGSHLLWWVPLLLWLLGCGQRSHPPLVNGFCVKQRWGGMDIKGQGQVLISRWDHLGTYCMLWDPNAWIFLHLIYVSHRCSVKAGLYGWELGLLSGLTTQHKVLLSLSFAWGCLRPQHIVPPSSFPWTITSSWLLCDHSHFPSSGLLR
jgi:hypothetical protein